MKILFYDNTFYASSHGHIVLVESNIIFMNRIFHLRRMFILTNPSIRIGKIFILKIHISRWLLYFTDDWCIFIMIISLLLHVFHMILFFSLDDRKVIDVTSPYTKITHSVWVSVSRHDVPPSCDPWLRITFYRIYPGKIYLPELILWIVFPYLPQNDHLKLSFTPLQSIITCLRISLRKFFLQNRSTKWSLRIITSQS